MAMKLIEDRITDYIIDNSTPIDPILKELERKTHLLTTRPRMLSGAVQGSTLRLLAKMLAPRRVAEIGTFTGYSAICMAGGMSEGSELHTIDVDDETAYIATDFFTQSGLSSIITQHLGSALDVIPSLGGVFDMVFMDGNKREYIDYYNMLLDGGYVASGSVIVADNVLWDGKVIEEEAHDKQTNIIREFNAMVAADSRVDVIILPFRDGMSLIRVK